MEWLQDYDWQAWLALAIALGAAELISGDLILLMLAVGAIAGMVVAIVTGTFVLQAVVAAVVAVALLGVVRPPLLRRIHNAPDLVTGFDQLIGTRTCVVSEIGPDSGQVRLAGEIWTARAAEPHQLIAAGIQVQVVAIQGATAIVTPIPGLTPQSPYHP